MTADILIDFYTSALNGSEHCREAVNKILADTPANAPTSASTDCRRELELALRTAGSHEVLIDALEWFFECQDHEGELSFDQVVSEIYEDPRYPIAEHLIYAFPYGQKRLRTIVELVGRAAGNLRRPLRILDVGCGPGVVSREVLNLFDDSELTVLDVSSSCLQYVSDMLGDGRSISTVKTDFLEFQASNTYDVIIASEVVEHVTSPTLALEGLRKLLAPAGALIVGVPIRLPMTMHLTVFDSVEQVLTTCQETGLTLIEGHIYPLYDNAIDLSIILTPSQEHNNPTKQ